MNKLFDNLCFKAGNSFYVKPLFHITSLSVWLTLFWICSHTIQKGSHISFSMPYTGSSLLEQNHRPVLTALSLSVSFMFNSLCAASQRDWIFVIIWAFTGHHTDSVMTQAESCSSNMCSLGKLTYQFYTTYANTQNTGKYKAYNVLGKDSVKIKVT